MGKINLSFFKGINIGTVITTVTTVVSGIETLFRTSRGAGRRKRVHAMRQISRELGIQAGSQEAQLVVSLVDLFGRFADDTEAFNQILAVYRAVSRPTKQLMDALDGDVVARDEMVEMVAEAIDIEAVPDSIETYAAGTLVDLALAQVRMRLQVDQGPGDR